MSIYMPSQDAMNYFYETQKIMAENFKRTDTSEKPKEEQEPTDSLQYNPEPYVSLVAMGDYK